MSLKITLNILLLFSFSIASGQIVPYKKFTSKDGLISDRITTIAQDEKGFMWFGSYFGICRYDGVRFQKLNLPPEQQNKYVTSLLSANGKVYATFLFGGGVAEFSQDKVKSYFIRSPHSNAVLEFTGMAKEEDGSILLCSKSKEVYRFKKGSFELLFTLQTKEAPNLIEKDHQKNIWLATEKGLIIYPYPYKDHQTYFPGQNITSLLKDEKGNFWISRTNGTITTIGTIEGLNEKGLIRENIISQQPYSGPVLFSGNTSRGFWNIQAKKGLINAQTPKEVNTYKIPDEFTIEINAVFTDRENNVWIANDPGILKVNNFKIKTYSFDEIAAGGGSIILESDSSLWASNSKSLYSVNTASMARKSLQNNKQNYYGLLYMDKKKNLWIGQWDGGIWCTKWKAGVLQDKTFFSQFNNIEVKAQCAIEDSNGNIWIGGSNGLFRIKDQKIVDHVQPIGVYGQPAFITSIALDESNKTLWLGDNTQGLIKLRYKEQPDNRINYTVTGYVAAREGLTDCFTRSLLFDTHKNLWVGTRFGGIFQIKESQSNLTVTQCNEKARLSCSRIMDIKQQDSTFIWFATCDGVYSYKYRGDHWTHYNTKNGILNAEVYSLVVDKRDEIWILTAEGITKLPINNNEKPLPPLVNITSVTVLGKPDDSALERDVSSRYTYDQNSIGFSFAGSSYIDEKAVRYKYKLEGFDKNWSEVVMSNSVNYASLPPGDYIFKVLSANVRNEWSVYPATFSFQIIRPFYQSLWFFFFLALVGLLLFYLVRNQQLKQRYRIEKIRVNIARDLHDDVGSALGSINILSKTATRRLAINADEGDITPLFTRIGKSAEDTLEAMDDIVWAINPQKDKVHDLVVRMREFAIPLFEGNNISFNFSVDLPNTISLPMNLRKNAFLVFKESVHNLLKHACATHVHINIYSKQEKIFLEIIDNGKGFSLNTPPTRNGLINMQTRAMAVAGELNISSSSKGTVIRFSAPLR